MDLYVVKPDDSSRCRAVRQLEVDVLNREREIKRLTRQAKDLLGDCYDRLAVHVPSEDRAERLLWLQELVEVGELLQGVCRHGRMETYEDGSMRFVGGDLIEYESIVVYCASCGRSLVHMHTS